MTHFPGNILLTSTPDIAVRATPEAIKRVHSELSVQLDTMRHGPQAVERTISFAYGRDPVVMRLLDLYLNRVTDMSAKSSDDDNDSTEARDWPTA